jgi:uroporphyrinogen-III synthase
VLVTRPTHQADTFIALLHAAGAETFALPAIEIKPLTISHRIEQRLQTGYYQRVIFISANAVQYGLAYLPQNKTLQIAAIGEGSARRLTEQKCHVDMVADCGFTSEHLLALSAMQANAVAGMHILIMRGQGGRTLLAETLQSRGAVVDHAEVYQRCRPQTDAHWLAPLWQKRIQLICVTSNETLENLYHMLGDYQQQLLNTLLLVPGARCYQLAQQLGFKQIIQAASATDTNMLQRIMQRYQTGV